MSMLSYISIANALNKVQKKMKSIWMNLLTRGRQAAAILQQGLFNAFFPNFIIFKFSHICW